MSAFLVILLFGGGFAFVGHRAYKVRQSCKAMKTVGTSARDFRPTEAERAEARPPASQDRLGCALGGSDGGVGQCRYGCAVRDGDVLVYGRGGVDASVGSRAEIDVQSA
jgi:hypothetical protein